MPGGLRRFHGIRHDHKAHDPDPPDQQFAFAGGSKIVAGSSSVSLGNTPQPLLVVPGFGRLTASCTLRPGDFPRGSCWRPTFRATPASWSRPRPEAWFEERTQRAGYRRQWDAQAQWPKRGRSHRLVPPTSKSPRSGSQHSHRSGLRPQGMRRWRTSDGVDLDPLATDWLPPGCIRVLAMTGRAQRRAEVLAARLERAFKCGDWGRLTLRPGSASTALVAQNQSRGGLPRRRRCRDHPPRRMTIRRRCHDADFSLNRRVRLLVAQRLVQNRRFAWLRTNIRAHS